MNLQDEIVVADPPADRHADVAASADVEEVECLISDLTALLDAGLIEVHDHVLGPVRYGVA